MKTTLILLFNLVFTTILVGQTTVSIADIQTLDNTSWTGNLMYINYLDGQPVNLRTTMQIEIKGNQIIMRTQFTDEPGANSKSSIKLKKGGSYFGSEKIIERTKLKDGTLKIVTTFKGKDDNKSASMFKIYLIGENDFSITKTVIFENSQEQLVRNKYTYLKV